MNRTYQEWSDSLKATMANVPTMGATPRETWGIVTLLMQMSLILLDIRELLKQLTDIAHDNR